MCNKPLQIFSKTPMVTYDFYRFDWVKRADDSTWDFTKHKFQNSLLLFIVRDLKIRLEMFKLRNSS